MNRRQERVRRAAGAIPGTGPNPGSNHGSGTGAAPGPALEQVLADAVALHQAGRLADAEALYRRVLDSNPRQPDAIHFLGVLASQRNAFDEAKRLLDTAVRLQPGNADIHNNLAVALSAGGAHAEAEAACRRALEIDPSRADTHYNLGIALDGQDRITDAVSAYRRAIELKPDVAAAYNNLANALPSVRSWTAEVRELEEIAAYYRKALELNPDAVDCHSNLMFFMARDRRYTAADIVAEGRRWDERHAVPLAALARPHENEPDADRRLRIGYVSPDFRNHAVNYFLEPLMAAHDPDQVELFCYAEIANPDEMTNRYRQLADHWRSTVGMTDHEVAEQVRADGIDILVDLASHTKKSRLLAFAERPAPVQVSHLVGLGQTTGMSAMDYVLTDSWVTAADCDTHYSEVPYRLDRCFLSFNPRSDWPDVSPSPARATGRVTFGSFGNAARITSKVVETWAEILRRVGGARLILMHNYFRDSDLRDGLRSAFAAHGVADRISFDLVERGWLGGMDTYRDIDIALDTWPMNGGTATCIALWMGLPVVTLVGETPPNRHGLSFLSAVGLQENAAPDMAGYVSRAVALAGDTDGLADLRAGLRARMAASPLLDHAGLARAVEAAYRDIWSRWCAGR